MLQRTPTNLAAARTWPTRPDLTRPDTGDLEQRIARALGTVHEERVARDAERERRRRRIARSEPRSRRSARDRALMDALAAQAVTSS